jgi:glycyl-tRNA synthetase beta chain
VGGDSTVLDERLIIDEEKRLFEEIKNIDKKINVFFETADYTAALTLLAELSIPVEAFFEHVMVMDDDPEIRQNRLNLLARLKGLFDHIANFALVS